MRKLIKCPKCGRANPQKRVTCSVCDTDLREAVDSVAPNSEPDKTKVCRSCGHLGEKGQALCPNCGFQFGVEPVAEQKKAGLSSQGFQIQQVKSPLSEFADATADSNKKPEKLTPLPAMNFSAI